MYADQKDYGKSAGRYDMAILFDNNRPVAYVKYANTYFHIAPDMAISRLKEIADRQPNSLLAQRELAEKILRKQPMDNGGRTISKSDRQS